MAWKHGHIVAAVLSRAQLCVLDKLTARLSFNKPQDEWEDDLEYEEFSVDQILDEMSLLQSDDEVNRSVHIT